MGTAQEEGKVGSYEEALLLVLDTGEPIDVSGHEDADGICRMTVSHFSAERLRLHREGTGDLTTAEGFRVHRVRLTSATPDAKYALIPNQAGGGEAVGEILGL